MKYYCYTFRGSPIAHQRPMTEEALSGIMRAGVTNPHNSCPITKDDYQVYELVPVEIEEVRVVTSYKIKEK